MPDWHGTKGIWVDRMLDPHCEFELLPHPWPWPLIFKVKFWKRRKVLRNGMPDWHGMKGMWADRMLDPHCGFEPWPHPWPWPLIFKVKFWKSRNSGMGCPIHMKRKGCESTEFWTHVVTFNFDLTHDLDPWFSRSNFEKVVAQELDGRLTWNERDVSRLNVGPMLWL